VNGSTGLVGGVEMSLLEGESALQVTGSLRDARRWFDTAYRTAEEQGDGPAMALAALGLGGLWVHEHRAAADAAMVRTRQRHALSLAEPGSSLALRLRVRLAGEDDYRSARHDTIIAMVAEARLARDPVALAEALSLAHHCLLGPEHGAARLELADELIGEASRTGRRVDLLMGLLWRAVDLVLAADPHAGRAVAELRGALDVEDHLAIRFVLDAMEVMLAIRAGRLAEAERLAGVCAERGEVAGDADSGGWYAGQLATIRWYEGRAAELVPLLADLVNSPDLSAVDSSLWAVLAAAAATAGQRRPAAEALARVCGRDLAAVPRSSSWLVLMHAVAEAAFMLGDTDVSARVYELLRPFERLPMIASLGVTCLGSVHHALGLASLTCGETDRAVGHLRAALRDNLALGHWPAAVHSRWRLGRALGDGPEAREQLDQARQEAASLGITLPSQTVLAPLSHPGTAQQLVIPQRAGVRLASVPPARGARAGVREMGADLPVAAAKGWHPGRRGGPYAAACSRRGRKWFIELDGRGVLIDNIVGMGHLATLLANPGREIPAIDLAAGPGAGVTAESPQPVLDEQARRAYQIRLSGLDDDISEAEGTGDAHRAAALRAEREWLIDELAAATGLAGRARRFSGSEERARIAVGKAIRRALGRIAEADPVIGEQLRSAVQTGLRCSYQPA
jgi:hypothetical protein